MPLTLYNTLSKKEEIFTPIEDGKVRFYTCGPTVYGRPHIGNYASFLMADLLARWLEVSGYKVTHVKNITDVGHLVADSDEGEDKIEKAAKEERTEPLDIAKKYEAQYLEDEEALNMRRPQHRPRATETIREMLTLVKTLQEKGHTYETNDGIYFSVETFPDYGKLSGNTLKNLSAGARVCIKEEKKHPADFALWKKCVGENSAHLLRWSFETGERLTSIGEDPSAGFPGWHIECSAMSTKFLGEQIDIHTGGEDNIFPHHECEIAQSECGSGKSPFVRMWVHRRRIDMGSEKMSKSLGNVLSLPDIVAKGFSPLDMRYLMLSVHYRTNLKFSWKGLEDAKAARRTILRWIDNKGLGEFAHSAHATQEDFSAADVQQYKNRFIDAMNDDLNTPAALAAVFECRNHAYAATNTILGQEFSSEMQSFIKLIRDTFGCFDPEEEEAIPSEVQELLSARQTARKAKDFTKSDQLRDQIRELGYEVRDEEGGQEIKKH